MTNPVALIVAPLEKFDVSSAVPQCGRWKDQMPQTRLAEPYKRYTAARKMWRNKRAWELKSDESQWIFHEVSWAAAQGDWGARALLSHFYLNGIGLQNVNQVVQPDQAKAVELMLEAAQAGQAWAYYDLGTAVENGYGGLTPDHDSAWRLYLKAARLGSADAQIALAQAYEKARKFDAATTMLECAFAQGSSAAANTLAMDSFIAGDLPKTIEYLQKGAALGGQQSSGTLYILFKEGWLTYKPDVDQQGWLDAHGYRKDIERGKRYEAIYHALELNKDLRFPLLDTAIPLPPAKLPEWNGIEDAIGPEPEGPPSY